MSLASPGVRGPNVADFASPAAPPSEAADWLQQTLRGFPALISDVELPSALAPVFKRFQVELAPLLRRSAPQVLPDDLTGLLGELAEGFRSQLSSLISSVLVLELNVARVRGHLRGDSPAERLRDFLARFPADFSTAVVEEYPELVQRIRQRYADAIASVEETFTRLGQDLPSLLAAFQMEPSAQLSSVTWSLGDRHSGGRTVSAFTFTDGTRLAYKPRPCAAAQRFLDVLAWVNERLNGPRLEGLQLVCLPTHGWVKWVDQAPLADGAQAKRFFFREGAQLALLHALRGTDLHEENLIAAGEAPVIIDLETLLHPDTRASSHRPDDDPAVHAYRDSVLSVGLLPEHDYTVDPAKAVASGGAYQTEGAGSDGLFPTLAGEGDTLAVRLEPLAEGQGFHLPMLEGRQLAATPHLDEFLEGFRAVYRLLERDREAFIAGPLAAFAGAPVRVIFRSTEEYANLLRASYHPDHLRQAKAQERLFGLLWRSAQQAAHWPEVVPHEVAALLRGDIPAFSVDPAQRDLVACSGAKVEGFFPQTPLAQAVERLRGLSEADLTRQEWIIRASFSTTEIARVRPGERPVVALERLESEPLLADATLLGDQLLDSAYRRNGRLGWLGITTGAEAYRMLRPLSGDLYDGRGGICLFLAQLGALTREPRFTDTARFLLEDLLAQAAQHPQAVRGVGPFNGWGGMAYLQLFLGRLWGERRLFDGAVAALARASAQDEPSRVDLLSGTAGLLAVATLVDEATRASEARQVMRSAVAQLSSRARPQGPDAVDWALEEGESNPGFGHGVGGVAYALARAGRRLSDEACVKLSLAAMRFEHGLFDGPSGNWLTAGKAADGERFQDDYVRWCWGGPGVGLARLALLGHCEDPFLREDAERAARVTLSRGFGESHCLCHGDLGNHDLLLQLGAALESPAIVHGAHGALAESLRLGRSAGWQCGNLFNVSTPGLLSGLAGVGYGLLRAAAPAEVPSLLSLQLPPERP